MNLKELQNPPKLATIGRGQAQPSLADLMDEAKDIPNPQLGLAYYKPVLQVLHKQKKMEAKEIIVWLKNRGCGTYTTSQIYRMLRK